MSAGWLILWTALAGLVGAFTGRAAGNVHGAAGTPSAPDASLDADEETVSGVHQVIRHQMRIGDVAGQPADDDDDGIRDSEIGHTSLDWDSAQQ